LFSEPSGVSEGYSIGEHTARVVALLENQAKPYGLERVALVSKIRDYTALMRYTLAFHDIGKSIAFRGGDKSRETQYSDPLAIDLLAAAGFNATEIKLGVGLISAHQLIGTYLQGRIGLDDSAAAVRAGAKYAEIDEQTFFTLLEIVFVCDAGSYPALYHGVFHEDELGRLVPNAEKYKDLRRLFLPGE
jgi:UTP:GlnB (protein PII) uridylyltransferase